MWFLFMESTEKIPHSLYNFFMCPGTSLSALPDLASRTAEPNKSSHVKIIVVSILSSAADRKDRQNI